MNSCSFVVVIYFQAHDEKDGKALDEVLNL